MNFMRCFTFFSVCLVNAALFAQSYVTPVRSDLTPPSPKSLSVIEVQNPQPDLLTGAVNVNVPIYNITVDDFQCPISLQYRTNGIKVFDDPCPLGYGWSLMPAFRITRTILGRPDELYRFSGDPQQADDPTAMCYMSSVLSNATSFKYKERYDSEHDIINITLPDKSFTRVIDARGDSIQFIGASDAEYMVLADNNLDSIIVVDPMGTQYYFGQTYESVYDRGGNYSRTAWPLYKIVTDAGRTINLHWSLSKHLLPAREWFGGYSFMDNWNFYQWANLGITQDEFVNDNYGQTVLSRSNETAELLQLDRIDFPGGEISFIYKNDAHLGEMMTMIKIASFEKVIQTYNLTYIDENNTLLSKINGGEGKCYSFEYNTEYGTDPFLSMTTGRHSQDWWGYYNAKENNELTPKLSVRHYTSQLDTEGSYNSEIGTADRSVDTTAMQALILKKVTWPAGGTSTFDYEPHEFAWTKSENFGEIDDSYNPALNQGGGLRVSEITTSAGTNNDIRVKYEYPLAKVRAVPSAASFMEVYEVAMSMPKESYYTTDPIARMRMVNIMPVSDYMRYDIGVTPLWYEKVSEVWPEGKIETYYEDIISQTRDVSPEVGYGYRKPSDMKHVFDGSPVMTKRIIYKSDTNGYTPVETTAYTYTTKLIGSSITNYHITRNIVRLEKEDISCPDMIDAYEINGGTTNGFVNCSLENTYSSKPYSIIPTAKILSNKKTTTHTEIGNFVSEERYVYKPGTGLITELKTSSSESKLKTVSIHYPDLANGGIEASMVKANVIGLPVSEQISYGNATINISANYSKIGKSAFRQNFISTSFGNSTAKINSPHCEYDALGHIIRVTDSDNIITEWTWDNMNLYPVLKNQAGLSTSFTYVPLVGVSAITQPYGAVSTFEYDNLNRLIKRNISGLGTIESISYTFAADANKISSTTWVDDLRPHKTTAYYDNLGRKVKDEDNSTGIVQHLRYDRMGRLFATSMPSAESPSSDYDYAMTFYEPTIQGNPLATVKSGELWHINKKHVRMRDITNQSSGNLSAPLYQIDADGNIEHLGNYDAGQLLIKEIADENGHVRRSYTNKAGLTVMTEEGDGAEDMLRVRNIYDDYGRLRYILTPAIDDGNISLSDDSFVKNCYELEYDEYGRLISKRFPGATARHKWAYSAAGRLVAEQTPYMADNDWKTYFYDNKGRLSYSALTKMTESNLKVFRQNFSIAEFVGNNTNAGYSLTPEPVINVSNAFSAMYYDDYEFLKLAKTSGLPGLSSSKPGLQTGAFDCHTGYSASEYDDWGRVIATYSETPKGVLTTRFSLYGSGIVYRIQEKLTVSDIDIYKLDTDISYDNAGRVSERKYTFNNKKAGVKYKYDKTGHIASEDFFNNVKRSYLYDCHGWSKEIKTSLPNFHSVIPDDSLIFKPLNGSSESNRFYSEAYAVTGLPGIVIGDNTYTNYVESIYYENSAHPRYDGTASAHVSTSGGRYDYIFDTHNRLVKASYTEGEDDFKNLSFRDFSVEYSYNEMGTPLSLKRFGLTDVTKISGLQYEAFGVIDNLAYDWDGMNLVSVTAAANGSGYYQRTGFPGSAEGGVAQYSWNRAGALLTDTSRGITEIKYNCAGLPETILLGDDGKIQYTYSTEDELKTVTAYSKLSDNHVSKVSERYYCGNFVFEGDSLIYADFAGGYFGGDNKAHYRHADFQGNITMVTDDDGNLEQHTGYYPYGEPWREPSGQPYLFGGKERMRDGTLNEYDFGPRRLNSALTLWSAPDRKADETPGYSPYSYCFGNPIGFVDPTGQKGKLVIDDNAMTFKANYYTVHRFMESLNNGIGILTDAFKGLSVQFTDKSSNRTIEIDLNIELESLPVDEKPNLGPKSVINPRVQEDDISNGYIEVEAIEKKTKDGNIEIVTGHSFGNHIEVIKDRASTETVSHEIGHTLGLEHSRSGIMTANANDKRRNKSLDLKALARDLKDILKSNKGVVNVILRTNYNIDWNTIIVNRKN